MELLVSVGPYLLAQNPQMNLLDCARRLDSAISDNMQTTTADRSNCISEMAPSQPASRLQNVSQEELQSRLTPEPVMKRKTGFQRGEED